LESVVSKEDRRRRAMFKKKSPGTSGGEKMGSFGGLKRERKENRQLAAGWLLIICTRENKWGERSGIGANRGGERGLRK